jgi:hypothetical protein
MLEFLRRTFQSLAAGSLALLALSACAPVAVSAATPAPTALPPIKHVFVIVEENEAASTTFAAGSPAPYLSQTLRSQGAYLSGYYGTGHNSLDNYIAMVSGQAPNALTSGDCPSFVNFASTDGLASNGQMTGAGCVYPSFVPSLMAELDSAGLTWRAYEDSMGASPAREPSTCAHPTVGQPDGTEGESASPFDAYATKHDPFVYFHGVIDNAAECSADVVNISQLSADLASASTTPNYVFITPDLCDDGHDATCANGGPGGLGQADTYLKTIVPEITGSAAYKDNGLLIVTFDESEGDDSSCCSEIDGPFDSTNSLQAGGGGPGGGIVGAVLLSPYIKAGTTSALAYNHYSMLATVEDIFGLPRLAEADCTPTFGADVFTNYHGAVAGAADPASPNCITVGDQSAVTTSSVITPTISALHLSERSLKPGAKASHRGSLTIGYEDSQASLTKFTVTRQAIGYSRGGHACVALGTGRKAPAHTHRCAAMVSVGSFTHKDQVGPNTVLFAGRVGGRLLSAGAYELETVPSLAGAHGSPATARFTAS